MIKGEKHRLERLDTKLAHWEATKEKHQAYRESHPDKPLTQGELDWLEAYQKLTHNPRWYQ